MSINQVSHSKIAIKANKIYQHMRQPVGIKYNYDIKIGLYKH